MTTLLRRGSKGAAVRDLQSSLNAAGAKLTVDGDFGKKTEAAVKAFQKGAELVVDGIADPNTLAALNRATAAPLPPNIDREPDKSAMGGEARGADPDGIRVVEEDPAPPPNVRKLTFLATARPIEEIVIHCTATPAGRSYSVADVRRWHLARGFSDVGYHFLVYEDGTIDLGRPIGQVGAHVAGRNTGTIGIAYFGGLTPDGSGAKDTRTAAQRSSLLWLVRELARRHPGIRRVSGHNQYAAKACPCFDVRKDALGRVLEVLAMQAAEQPADETDLLNANEAAR